MREQKKSNFSTVTIIILGLIAGIFGTLYYDTDKQLSNKKYFNEALLDSLQSYKDKEGNYVSKISNIQDVNTDYLLQLKSGDSIIGSLQNEMKRVKAKGGLVTPGSSVTIIERETGVDISTPSTVTEVDNDITIKSDFNLDGWVIGAISAKRDTTKVNLQVYDEFSVRLDYEPQGWLGLGAPKPFTELTSKNPYSKTKVLRTYEVSTPPEPNLIIGPSIGLGFGGFFAGVTATYPLIKIRI